MSGLFFFFKFIKADFSDTIKISDSIGTEDKAEYPRNKIVQLFTSFEVLEILAFGTNLLRGILFHIFRLKSMSNPKSMIIVPEILFSQTKLLWLTFSRKIPATPLIINHHIPEPVNTPAISRVAEP